MNEFTHLKRSGDISMVDISEKTASKRTALAEGFIKMQKETLRRIADSTIPKGNVFTTARLAGIQAAKQTYLIIPLCHNISLSWIDIAIEAGSNGCKIRAEVKANDSTGVEMEALTAVSVCALTIYDMCKAVDKTMCIESIKLISKTGGKSTP